MLTTKSVMEFALNACQDLKRQTLRLTFFFLSYRGMEMLTWCIKVCRIIERDRV